MATSTNGFTYAALLGALAIVAITPASAFAEDSSGTGRRGAIVVTTPPTRASDLQLPVVTQATITQPDPLKTPVRPLLTNAAAIHS